jgi:hypothetical protein
MTAPVMVVIVLTSKPAATFSPLAESLELFHQKAVASRDQKLRNATQIIKICRFIALTFVSLTDPAGIFACRVIR